MKNGKIDFKSENKVKLIYKRDTYRLRFASSTGNNFAESQDCTLLRECSLGSICSNYKNRHDEQ